MKKVKKEESPAKKRKSDDDEYSPAKVDPSLFNTYH